MVEKTKDNLRERQEAKPLKKPAKALTEKEAEELREQLFQAYAGIFNFSDTVIQHTSGGHQEVEIWSTIDDADITLIVDARLTAAKHSARAAKNVHRTIAIWQQMSTAVILGPRFLMTWQLYSERGFDFPIKLGGRRRHKLKVVQHEPVPTGPHLNGDH